MVKLQADNERLRKEKRDVVQENAAIKQEAHRDLERAERRLKADLKEARRRGDEAAAEAAKATAAFAEAANERDGLQQHKQHLEARVREARPAPLSCAVPALTAVSEMFVKARALGGDHACAHAHS